MRAVKLLFILAFIVGAYAATIDLIGIIRDQAPDTMRTTKESEKYGSCGEANRQWSNSEKKMIAYGFEGTDFQIPGDQYKENEKGLVGAQCTPDNVKECGRLANVLTDPSPKYAHTGKSPDGNIKSPESFRTWFHNSDRTRNVEHRMTLKESSDDLYTYQNDNFFPIDDKGWKDYHWKSEDEKHNYGFCMEAHTRFGYRGTESFEFFGDDDVWVYVNNYLVIDLGSLHPKLQMKIELKDIAPSIGMVPGGNYRLDFFYCERHTAFSNFKMATSLEFKCTTEDWCGVCEGSGQSCCTEERLKKCDNGNPCMVASCGVKTGACVYSNRTCDAPTKCQTASCDRNRGGCVNKDIDCSSSDPCWVTGCDPKSGCVREPRTCDQPTDKCKYAECVPGVGCVERDIKCEDPNKCTAAFCDPDFGCRLPQKNCNDGNPCTTDTCDPDNGCVNAGCDDKDSCTNDVCVEGKGCSFPAKCGTPGKCIDAKCNNGQCSFPTFPCEPKDICHTASCTNATGCIQTPISCDDGDACTKDFCDVNRGGCVNEDTSKQCDDKDACTENLCLRESGCVFKKLNLDDKNDCTADSCDIVKGVRHDNITCEDNNVCTFNGCNPSGGCSFTRLTCDDKDLCTKDICDENKPEGQQCINTKIPGCTGCKDANDKPLICQKAADQCFPEICDVVAKKCSNTTVSCDDGNACTQDSCKDGKCSSKPACAEKTCQMVSCDPSNGKCNYTPLNCNDDDPCTEDSCSPTTGKCQNIRVPFKYCFSCGSGACKYNNTCAPEVCDASSSTCKVEPITCNDNNACTKDKCVEVNGKPSCANPEVVTCTASGDVCNPNVCDPKSGCKRAPVDCSSPDRCSEGTCVSVENVATCLTTPKNCSDFSVDACFPAVCQFDGTCGNTTVSCDDENPCTDDVCTSVDGVASCSSTPVVCGYDECGQQQCSLKAGKCISAPKDCNDYNDCTTDSFTCNGTATVCNNTLNSFCNDNDLCTNDVCDSTNTTDPCRFEPVVCEPRGMCDRPIGCNASIGCIYEALPCEIENQDACKVPSCDDRVGCILQDVVCIADDEGCFKAQCNSSAVAGQYPCYEEKKDNWGTRKSENGIICAFRYDDTIKKVAIGTGAAVGIAIAAAAGAGALGYGGKKGYDHWKTMQDQRFNGVQNNPLYDAKDGETENPIYRHSAKL